MIVRVKEDSFVSFIREYRTEISLSRKKSYTTPALKTKSPPYPPRFGASSNHCGSTKRQSPIDLPFEHLLWWDKVTNYIVGYNQGVDLTLTLTNAEAASFTTINGYTSITVPSSQQSKHAIRLNGEKGGLTYYLRRIDIKYPAEHTVHGFPYGDAELQMVMFCSPRPESQHPLKNPRKLQNNKGVGLSSNKIIPQIRRVEDLYMFDVHTQSFSPQVILRSE